MGRVAKGDDPSVARFLGATCVALTALGAGHLDVRCRRSGWPAAHAAGSGADKFQMGLVADARLALAQRLGHAADSM